VITVKEMYAGDGYKYLLKNLADAQGMPGATSAVTAYYTSTGNPHGRWVGGGLAGLDSGRGLAAESIVDAVQMERLFRHGADPASGHQLGRRFIQPKSLQERIAARVERLPETMPTATRADVTERIEAEEKARRVRRPVAGFDFTFSPPKSVSVVFAVADQGMREQVYEAHRAAVADALAVIERDVARTRVGTDGVAQVHTRGIIGAAFDHWDSRAGDPHLHTHVVIANRVQGPDGGWRTLDSRGALFPSVVAMSELYDNLLADHLTARLGTDWRVRRTHRSTRSVSWEVDGVPDALIEEFSIRRRHITAARDHLTADTRPRSDEEARLLDERAWRETRPDKEVRPLVDLTREWVDRATRVLSRDPGRLVARLTRWSSRRQPPLLRVDDLHATGAVDQLAKTAYTELATSKTTWTMWNIRAAAARACMGHRMIHVSERGRLLATVAAGVRDRSLAITPPPLAHTPQPFVRPDGSSAFRRENAELFTSEAILAAEDRILQISRDTTGPTVDAASGTFGLDQSALDEEQEDAVAAIVGSGRRLDILVGPAGTGKTTTLTGLKQVWEAANGGGSVVGMAPSAKASAVLADALGIGTDNTEKWVCELARRREGTMQMEACDEALADLDSGAEPSAVRQRLHDRLSANADGDTWLTALPTNPNEARLKAALKTRRERLAEDLDRWRLRADQLVVVDEASLSGTLALDALAAEATTAGAKLLLVGDWAQLSSVDAGGAFGMVVRDRGADVPELAGVRRFRHEWERAASVRLRVGDESVVDVYNDHGRLHDGRLDDVLDAAYVAWRADEQAGRQSLLIAGDNKTVTELNMRTRADRVAAGEVAEDGVRLQDGSRAGVGDRIVTRSNDRRLATGPHGWVKNGDYWTVTSAHHDGSLTVRRTGRRAGTITLPAAYVAEHVDLGYAVTAHRAQGTTVDTAHLVVTVASMMREVFYVAMTRGRQANNAYIAVDAAADCDHDPTDELPTMGSMVSDILHRRGDTLSATETITEEQEAATRTDRLIAEYDTIAREAEADHWHGVLSDSFTAEVVDELTESAAYPQLVSAIRHATTAGLDPATLVGQLAHSVVSPSVEDRAHALAEQVRQVTDHAGRRKTRPKRRMIVGLLPAADHVDDPDMARALVDREQLLESRASALAAAARAERPAWLAELGPRPAEADRAAAWDSCLITVVAYRDCHVVADPDRAAPSVPTASWTQRGHHRRVIAATLKAHSLTATDTEGPQSHVRTPRGTERTL